MKKRFALSLIAVFLTVFVSATISSAFDTSEFYRDDGSFLLARDTSEDSGDLDDELMSDYETDESEPVLEIADPLYYFNYAMYGVNDFLHTIILKPVAMGYKTITPSPVRQGIRNFFHNLFFPIRFVNNLLQGEIEDAGKEVGIFAINTTLGVLGFGQVAQENFDLQTADEDLGQTFGKWGMGHGFYLFLPIIGPTSLRDGVGRCGDYFLSPVTYVEPWEWYWGLNGTYFVNEYSYRFEDYDTLKKAAVDPYSAFKNAYLQNRLKKVNE